MTAGSEIQVRPDQPWPRPAKAIGYMIATFFLRLVQFILIVTGLAVGVATVVVWVGFPILLWTTSFIRWSGDLERRWIGSALRTPLPPAERLPLDGLSLVQRWQRRLTDATTWRDLGY